MHGGVQQAREAVVRQAWGAAYRAYADAEAAGAALGADDLDRFAVAAYLVGEDDRSVAAWDAAHRAATDGGDAAEAARCAFWIALTLLLRGRMAQAGGWLGRAQRLVEDAGHECAASGYVLVPQILGALQAGDTATARDLAAAACDLGRRLHDADLLAFGTLGDGQALIASGDVAGGTARLDEVMVSVSAGEVGPVATGIVYCAVILECVRLLDLHRASEWTAALEAWCSAQPDLVPYRGQCLVHRSQVEQAAGHWSAAAASASAACALLSEPPHPALGLARYQAAELHRLVGDHDAATAAYRDASRHGHDPMPGLALLQAAAGHVADAAASIRRALHEQHDPLARNALLSAAAEILVAAGDLAGARGAADELAAAASRSPASSDVLQAMASQATGTVLVAEGDPAAAAPVLRHAASIWHAVPVPYEAARVAVLLGLACAALGDRTSAGLHLEQAADAFAALGARPDLDRVRALADGLVGGAPTPAGLLSAREREVLALVAAGKTNRVIAEELHLSPHTVGRHVENIYAKLGVTTRAAATAAAYEHDLL